MALDLDWVSVRPKLGLGFTTTADRGARRPGTELELDFVRVYHAGRATVGCTLVFPANRTFAVEVIVAADFGFARPTFDNGLPRSDGLFREAIRSGVGMRWNIR